MQCISHSQIQKNRSAHLEQLNLMGEMATHISHEIRNPLTTLYGLTQILRNKEEFRDFIDQFDLILKEINKVNFVIENYLTLSPDRVLNLKMQNLNDIIIKQLPGIRAKETAVGKNIIVKLDNIPRLLLNEKEIGLMVLNLCENAFQATNDGGTVVLRTFTEDKKVALSVEDDGKGIEPKIFNNLGTPFLATEYNRTGLGLTVCCSIAAKHNAVIDVETSHKGTTFTVWYKI